MVLILLECILVLCGVFFVEQLISKHVKNALAEDFSIPGCFRLPAFSKFHSVAVREDGGGGWTGPLRVNTFH